MLFRDGDAVVTGAEHIDVWVGDTTRNVVYTLERGLNDPSIVFINNLIRMEMFPRFYTPWPHEAAVA